MHRSQIAWEMGGGLGHVGPLRAIAQELGRRGHDVCVTTQNTQLCDQALGGTAAEVVPCPRLPLADRRLRVPCTFADVLHDGGYASAERVVAAVGRWLRLLDELRPSRLLADYSPTAMLAARVRGVPTAVIGSGFVCPPDRSPLPCLHPVVREPHWAAGIEATVLATMNAALSTYGGRPLERVSQLYADAAWRDLLLGGAAQPAASGGGAGKRGGLGVGHAVATRSRDPGAAGGPWRSDAGGAGS
ncbi:hypothetical protein [Botrimarina sp.]|uniref:hypothetical protein n=1 Tax=Botrimarina sp. TaxID=2795802 RepID=UPI0032EDD3D3